MFALQEAKKKMRAMEAAASQLKAENQRWELEFSKQQKRIDRLLDPASGHKSGQASLETRRDIEKTLLVRQLKQNIQSLRGVILEKDAEIETFKRSQKTSKFLEFAAEREEYITENNRLRKILKEIKDELQNEKQRREWGKSMTAGGNMAAQVAGNELKKEVARLASGYQSILTGMSQAADAVIPTNRVIAQQIIANTASKRPKSAHSRPLGGAAATLMVDDFSNQASLEDSIFKGTSAPDEYIVSSGAGGVNREGRGTSAGSPKSGRPAARSSTSKPIGAFQEPDFVIERDTDGGLGTDIGPTRSLGGGGSLGGEYDEYASGAYIDLRHGDEKLKGRNAAETSLEIPVSDTTSV